MSVNFTAGLGFGYIISQQEFQKLYHSDKYEEIEDCCNFLDAYNENSDVFFGEFLALADAGYSINLDLNFNKQELIKKYMKIPQTVDWGKPDIYLLNIIS